MTARHPPHSDIGNLATSRRALLGAFALAPVVTLPVRGEVAVPQQNSLRVSLPLGCIDSPVTLRRTRAGRNLSRFRYRNAESFFASVEDRKIRHGPDLLYQTGIVIQLALSSHLLDVGFDDAWCARYLGLNIAKSLACANATGLDHRAPDMERLAATLSPYSRWRYPDLSGAWPNCSYSRSDVGKLTRSLLDRVREATGHPRAPRAGRRRHG